MPSTCISPMWRVFFMAIAISLLILGAECLVIERAVLAKSSTPPPLAPLDYIDPLEYMPPPELTTHRVVEPPAWAPWSLLGAGAVVMLYSLTLKGKSD